MSEQSSFLRHSWNDRFILNCLSGQTHGVSLEISMMVPYRIVSPCEAWFFIWLAMPQWLREVVEEWKYEGVSFACEYELMTTIVDAMGCCGEWLLWWKSIQAQQSDGESRVTICFFFTFWGVIIRVVVRPLISLSASSWGDPILFLFFPFLLYQSFPRSFLWVV